MFEGRRVLVVLNPSSGKGEAAVVDPAIASALEEMGADLVELRPTEGPDDARAWGAAAAAEGFDLLVAGGGDGTLAALAAGVLDAGHRLPIGILPMGTANGMARVLGIPMQTKEAIKVLNEGRVVEVDAIRVRSHDAVSLVFCGAGLDARINRDAQGGGGKSRMGMLAYVGAALANLRAPRNHDLSITLDGERIQHLKGHTVSAFNATRLSVLGMGLGPDAQPHDGLVDVVVMRSTGFWRNLLKVLRLINRATSHLELQPVRRLRIDAVPPLPVQIDGDVVGQTPLEFEVEPAALRLIASAAYRDDEAAAGRAT